MTHTQQLYMLIDVTDKPAGVKLLAVAPLREIQLLGRLAKAEGKDVMGPPIEGRGFSTLVAEELQYFIWNSFAITPPNDYPDLIKAAMYHTLLQEPDKTDLRDLEKLCEKITPESGDGQPESGDEQEAAGESKPAKKRAKKEVPSTESKEKKAPAPKAAKDPNGRPASTTTTGLVWDHADTALAKFKGKEVDVKELSKAVRALCENDGINPGTVSVQFGKWKKFTLSA